jgi:hypothetical protein
LDAKLRLEMSLRTPADDRGSFDCRINVSPHNHHGGNVLDFV